ncbi:ubiquitin-protein ligase E3 A [Pancytospora epiphaga]|nr:ubiquitin-protein ligase E3 A [Pancytospora epiphaga]
MEEYREQMKGNCIRRNCLRIFCRSCHKVQNAEQIPDILASYGDIFLCKNIVNIFTSKAPTGPGYPIIDLFFYTSPFIYRNDKGRRTGSDFIHRKTKTGAYQKIMKRRNLSKESLVAKPCQSLDHNYCFIANKNLEPLDVYLLVGVIHLLLNRFKLENNFNVGIIIIRLFIVISKGSSLDPIYYNILYKVYEFVYNKITSSLVDIPLNASPACKYSTCLFYTQFSQQDFINSVEAISTALNSSIITNVRENTKIHALLDIFNILHKINKSVNILEYEKFYLRNFCSKINLKTEFRFYRSKYNSALNYSFIVPIHMKAEILKMENSDTMKNTLQDVFFRSLFEGVIEPYLFITIGRKTLYKDTLDMLENLDPGDLKKQLKIKFLGEEGVDSGGIRKEYFQLLSQEIAADKTLFFFKNNRMWLKSGVCLRTINKIGKLAGMALYNDVVLNLPFPFLIFKKILKRPLNFNDLAEIEPEHYRSLVNLEKCDAEELRSSDLYFTIERMELGTLHTYELIPNGTKVPVTVNNFADFKKRYFEFYTENLVEAELKAFLEGFNAVVDPKSITLLEPRELEKIIIGLDEFDLAVIKSTATYGGYTESMPIIEDFWSIVENYNYTYKKKLLQFITGNDRLPVAGSKALRLTIVRNGGDTERLPSSQTCFNTLLLPEYNTREKLARKLSKALKLAAGFFLI